MPRVHIDISVFTPDAAFAMVSGPMELETIPNEGELVSFNLTEPVNASRGNGPRPSQLPFRGQLMVTNRITNVRLPDVLLALEDLTVPTSNEARRLVEMLERDCGLSGDIWED